MNLMFECLIKLPFAKRSFSQNIKYNQIGIIDHIKGFADVFLFKYQFNCLIDNFAAQNSCLF